MADRHLLDELPIVAAIAERLNLLDEVRWDRFTAYANEVTVYGWIDRGDGRSDFVLITFAINDLDDSIRWEQWFTSSAACSQSIYQRLSGRTEGHVDCQRVDQTFGRLVRHTASMGGSRG